MEKAQILIVEDDGIIAMDLESRMKQLGYGVTGLASYGAQAIEKVKENKPDIVLMDIILKGEIDGIDAAEEIRTKFDIPIIFITGYADKERLKRAKLAYPFGFIIKPFSDKDLEVTIEMALYVAKVDAERKQAEEEIRKIKESYDRITDNADEVIFRVGGQGGYVTYANPAAERLLGYSLAEWLDDHALGFKIIHPDFKEKQKQIIEEINANKKTIKNAILGWITKDGREIIVEYTIIPLMDKEGKIIYFESIGRDITERKKAEEALRQAHDELEQRVKERTAELTKATEQLEKEIDERKRIEDDLRHSELWMRGIFKSLEETVLVVTPDRKIVSINEAGERMFGYSKDELANLSTEVLHVDQEHCIEFGRQIKEAFDRGEAANFEFKAKRKNGEVFLTEHTVSLLKNDAGETIGIVSIVRDITKRKQKEE